MRIIHFSDWHDSYVKLPEADLYVCTGDLYPNWMKPKKITKKNAEKLRFYAPNAHGGSADWGIDQVEEIKMQKGVARALQEKGGFKQFLGSPKAPVVCVRGNHDFYDLAPLFADCDVTEFKDNEVVEVLGLRVTGHRGVPPISGMWQDETPTADLLDRFRRMDPTCDLYLTHYPPAGCGLDLPGNWGLAGASNHAEYTWKEGALWCLGHIHEGAGIVNSFATVTYSNAATTFNILEREDGSWSKVNV